MVNSCRTGCFANCKPPREANRRYLLRSTLGENTERGEHFWDVLLEGSRHWECHKRIFSYKKAWTTSTCDSGLL